MILVLKTAVQVLERWEEHLMVLGSHLNEQARSCSEVWIDEQIEKLMYFCSNFREEYVGGLILDI